MRLVKPCGIVCVYMRGSRCGMNTCHEEAPFLYWCAIFLMLDHKILRCTVVSTRIVYAGTRTVVRVCVQMLILYALFRTLSLRYVRTVQLSYTGTADSLCISTVHVQRYGMGTCVLYCDNCQYGTVWYGTVQYSSTVRYDVLYSTA